jgi:hypothetical protein
MEYSFNYKLKNYNESGSFIWKLIIKLEVEGPTKRKQFQINFANSSRTTKVLSFVYQLLLLTWQQAKFMIQQTQRNNCFSVLKF